MLTHTRNKIPLVGSVCMSQRGIMKHWVVILALASLSPTSLYADQLFCKLQQKYLYDAYGYSYASLNTASGAVRLGDGEKWTDSFTAKRKTVAIGEKFTWRQVLYNKKRNRNYNVNLTFRILKDGSYDLFVDGNWRIPLNCKL